MSNEYMQGAGVAEPPAETDREKDSAARAESAASRDAADDAGGVARAGLPRSVWREYFESLVVTAIMALFGMTFVVQAVKVPTGSMQNTILIGDHLLVNKFIFAPGPPLPFLPMREIRRGDIIVFKYPGNRDNPESDLGDPTSTAYTTNFVKRVVGLPGDRIETRGARVYINGQPLDERRQTAVNLPDNPLTSDRKESDAPLELENTPPVAGTGPYTVYYDPETRLEPGEGATLKSYPSFRNGNPVQIPDDSYFVMGDNRSNSRDSREWGFVPRDLVIGRAMFVYWSYDESASSQGNPFSNFLNNSRWGRTGTLIK